MNETLEQYIDRLTAFWNKAWELAAKRQPVILVTLEGTVVVLPHPPGSPVETAVLPCRDPLGAAIYRRRMVSLAAVN